MIEQLGNVSMPEKYFHHNHPQGLKAASKLGEYIWADSNPVKYKKFIQNSQPHHCQLQTVCKRAIVSPIAPSVLVPHFYRRAVSLIIESLDL